MANVIPFGLPEAARHCGHAEARVRHARALAAADQIIDSLSFPN